MTSGKAGGHDSTKVFASRCGIFSYSPKGTLIFFKGYDKEDMIKCIVTI